jgi:hypothetical protein
MYKSKVVKMFEEKAFAEALRAYSREKSDEKSDAFFSLRKNNKFFLDIKTKEDVTEQIKVFMSHISKMDRGNYGNRYVIQTFILEFCKYLDKDFLFNITDKRTFFSLKPKLKTFTSKIYENNKRFTQTMGQNSLEHLLDDYGTLLQFVDLDDIGEEQGEPKEVFGLWSGNKLW